MYDVQTADRTSHAKEDLHLLYFVLESKAGSKVSIEGSNERTVSYSHYQRTGES